MQLLYVRLQYFYSIKDISVGGQCICYGHARYCPMDPVTRVSHGASDLPATMESCYTGLRDATFVRGVSTWWAWATPHNTGYMSVSGHLWELTGLIQSAGRRSTRV